jgi:hypothetical protein
VGLLRVRCKTALNVMWAIMKKLMIVIATVLALGACTPNQETIIKQLGACKMQAIEKGFRDDPDYLTACMNAAGYRPKLDCMLPPKDRQPTQDYRIPPIKAVLCSV